MTLLGGLCLLSTISEGYWISSTIENTQYPLANCEKKTYKSTQTPSKSGWHIILAPISI